jgi:hypothetical protein
MNHTQSLAVVVIGLIAVAVIAFLVARKRRSDHLRARFGPEYDRVVKQEGGVHRAEGVLEFREKRREKLAIRPLAPTDRARYEVKWEEVQGRFVDDPAGAVAMADQLVAEVMQSRGYPVGDFEQRAADISVDYPVVVDNYRAAHSIAVRHSRGESSTEDLRRGMVHYRTLFQELLGPSLERKEA